LKNTKYIFIDFDVDIVEQYQTMQHSTTQRNAKKKKKKKNKKKKKKKLNI